MKTCQVCTKPVANCSPFRDGARRWDSVCGGCKFRITLGDPARAAKLRRDIAAFGRAALAHPSGAKN